MYDRAVAYHIQNGDHAAALSVLKQARGRRAARARRRAVCVASRVRFKHGRTPPSQAPFDKVEDLFYHFSVILMEQSPESTVRIWMTKPRLQATKLLPALIRYSQSYSRQAARDDVEPDWAMRYLEFCVSDGNEDPSIHNYLLSLYALQSDDGPLLKFLKSSSGLVDLQYALRVSTQHRQTKACIFIYSKMGLYEEAVKMALGEDINLAKENANLPPDREVQKRLWLMIARFIIEDANSDIKDSIHVRAQHARRASCCPVLTANAPALCFIAGARGMPCDLYRRRPSILPGFRCHRRVQNGDMRKT